MNAAARAASISAVAALVLAAAWLFWPAQLGGATTYVSTYGVSMEPGFSTGDLAVLRPASSYEVGDVVAYHSESLDTVVMHRIVAVDGDRFVLQGDNNDWLDTDRPTSDELLGTLFRQVPQGGRVLGAIASPWSAALVAAAALGAFGRTRRRPRGRHTAGRSASTRGAAAASLPTAFSMPTRAQARQVAVASGAVLVLATGGAAVLFALPSTEEEAQIQPVTQEGRYEYAGRAEVGTTYPTGAIATGDPVYVRLADEVTVSFEHSISAAGLSGVGGSLRLDLSVVTADGWSAALGSSPPAPVQDGPSTATARIQPAAAAALVERHNTEIGGGAGSATVVVTPVVEVTGAVQGRPFTAAQLAPLAFTMDSVALRPSTSASALAPTAAVPVSVDGVVPRSFSVLALDLPIGVARLAAVAVLAVALLVTAAAGWIGRPRTGDAADEFAVRNASRILPVTGLSAGGNVVDVSDAQALRRVADRVDGLVLHHAGPTGQTFAVQDNETTYRFVFPDTATVRPSRPPLTVRAPAPATAPLPRIA